MASGDQSPLVRTHPPVNTSTSDNVPSSDVNPQPERFPRNPNLLVHPHQYNPTKPHLRPPDPVDPEGPEVEPPDGGEEGPVAPRAAKKSVKHPRARW